MPKGCLITLLAALAIGVLSPFILGYLYKASAASHNAEVAELFATRLPQEWGAELPSADAVKGRPGEISIFSSAREPQGLLLKISVVTAKEDLFGQSTFVRCYTLAFDRVPAGGFRHTVEDLPGCPYEEG
ncbi:hypothetical protein AB0J35_47795 [Nonomuraea angiospora]|uniref:hypothetical protein n=1 Tax=Nonomuraea angiospora TaxID=46172 RepID=UPI00343C3029